jgi:molecular chaperone HtpG
LRAPEIGLDGVAFVLAESSGIGTRQASRVYVKRMLLSEQIDRLLPDWAFFLRCVVNSSALNPNASREQLQEDEMLEKARIALDRCIRDYLLGLARLEPRRLQEFIARHLRAIKLLATQDEEFYALIIDWLPFETSQGVRSMREIRDGQDEILFASHIDIFRQLAPVASAQGICLINAGYTSDVELVERLPELFSDLRVRSLEPSDLLDQLDEPPLKTQDGVAECLEAICAALARFSCSVELKSFRPTDLPALYTLSESARFFREVDRTKDHANELWSGVLDGLRQRTANDARGQLCLNWQNPLIRSLLELRDSSILRRAAELLYTQALLAGHFPLDAKERQALCDGLHGLIGLAISASK